MLRLIRNQRPASLVAWRWVRTWQLVSYFSYKNIVTKLCIYKKQSSRVRHQVTGLERFFLWILSCWTFNWCHWALRCSGPRCMRLFHWMGVWFVRPKSGHAPSGLLDCPPVFKAQSAPGRKYTALRAPVRFMFSPDVKLKHLKSCLNWGSGIGYLASYYIEMICI